ncbi:MAG: DUF3025 domain-containing protein [Pseudomonadota bacterium]
MAQTESGVAGPPSLDWGCPWLRPWAGPGAPAWRQWATGGSVVQALAATQPTGSPVRFVSHDVLSAGAGYERFIAGSGSVPTRDNLHDFFNGLAWLLFPQAKARLNRVHAEAETRPKAESGRGPARDAATLFDENGALLAAPDVLWQALAARDWPALFVTHRACWAEARLLLFGHALLEKLASPRKAITAHVLRLPLAAKDLDTPDAADGWLATRLDASLLASKPFLPLPVLGVPGWWAANEDRSFYDDARVFRRPATPAG